jgi:hypothetical protein
MAENHNKIGGWIMALQKPVKIRSICQDWLPAR